MHRDEPSPTMPPSSQPVFFVCLDVIVKGKRRLKTSMNSPLSHHRLRAAALVVDGPPDGPPTMNWIFYLSLEVVVMLLLEETARRVYAIDGNKADRCQQKSCRETPIPWTRRYGRRMGHLSAMSSSESNIQYQKLPRLLWWIARIRDVKIATASSTWNWKIVIQMGKLSYLKSTLVNLM